MDPQEAIVIHGLQMLFSWAKEDVKILWDPRNLNNWINNYLINVGSGNLYGL